MTYVEAQTEFCIRLYHWAAAAQKLETEESFPSFQFCKEWPSRRCKFIASLAANSRAVLAQALLVARHPIAAKALSLETSEEAGVLMRREEGFRLRTSPGTWEGMFMPANAASKPILATRRQLKKAVKDHFLMVFGDQCIPPDIFADKAGLQYQMKCRGWIVKTYFDFGRWEPEISYQHDVWNGKWITKQEPAILPFNSLSMGLNYGNELGIGSGWDNIAMENVEAVCTMITDHCQRMFDLFPALLEGLDLEQLTG